MNLELALFLTCDKSDAVNRLARHMWKTQPTPADGDELLRLARELNCVALELQCRIRNLPPAGVAGWKK